MTTLTYLITIEKWMIVGKGRLEQYARKELQYQYSVAAVDWAIEITKHKQVKCNNLNQHKSKLGFMIDLLFEWTNLFKHNITLENGVEVAKHNIKFIYCTTFDSFIIH